MKMINILLKLKIKKFYKKCNVKIKKIMTNFVKIKLDPSYGDYSYKEGSNIEMDTLGTFLTSDVGCQIDNGPYSWQSWALNDRLGMATSGNITCLEKEGDYLFLTDQCSQEKDPTELKMSRQQFVQLLDEWQEKVCKTKPKEVIIKHENNIFFIEITE